MNRLIDGQPLAFIEKIPQPVPEHRCLLGVFWAGELFEHRRGRHLEPPDEGAQPPRPFLQLGSVLFELGVEIALAEKRGQMTISRPSASPSAAMSGRSEMSLHATQQMALISSGSLVALSSIFLTPIPCAPHSPHSGQ